MEAKTITRQWGNSIAVVLPKILVLTQQLHANEEVVISVRKRRPRAGELFGILKGKFKEPTQKIKDEMRRGWESASDREQNRKWRK